MKFDNILEEIDGCGWFQVLIVTLLCIPRVILPCHFLLNNFIAAVPSHHCDLSALDDGSLFGNLTQEQRLTVSVPVQEDGTPSSCKMFPEPQFHILSNSNNSDLATVPCQNGWTYDNSTFKSTMATEWDLVCDRKGMNKATATIFFVGVMIGAIAFGTLTDKFGRKPMLLVSYTISMVFGFASAFSNSYTMFGVMRFFTGFGLTGISIISTVLSVEWVDIKHRALIGITGSMAWSFGNMMLAGIAYQVNDWRMLMIAVSAPLGLAIITWCIRALNADWLKAMVYEAAYHGWLPESARWLIANGKVERAHLYLEKCARFNNRKDFTSKIKLEHLSDVVGTDNHNKTYSYLDLVRTPKMRRLALLTGIVWYGVASTYYGISLNITGFGLNVYLTHFIYSAIEVPAKMVVYFCLDTIGRKHCQAGTLLLTGTCIAINIFVPKGQWHVRTIVAVLGKGLSEASFTTVILYTAELYPTVVRQNGLGYNNFMARLGVSIAPLIILLEDVWKPLPEVIICCVSILSGLVAFLLPETHNARLPETIEDIEQTKKRNPIFVSPLEKTEVLLKSQKNNELDQ